MSKVESVTFLCDAPSCRARLTSMRPSRATVELRDAGWQIVHPGMVAERHFCLVHRMRRRRSLFGSVS